MTLLTIAIVLIVTGFLLWLVNTYIPMTAPLKSILNLVVIVGVIIWLLSATGIIPPIHLKLR